jgi:ferric-dicitrate binding protein FerR (iron transport regulator)
LVFDFALLTEVAEEFNRYNRRPMKVQCGATAAPPDADDPCNFKISGSFSSTDPTLLLRFLREQVGIVVEETANEIRISRQGTPG